MEVGVSFGGAFPVDNGEGVRRRKLCPHRWTRALWLPSSFIFSSVSYVMDVDADFRGKKMAAQAFDDPDYAIYRFRPKTFQFYSTSKAA